MSQTLGSDDSAARFIFSTPTCSSPTVVFGLLSLARCTDKYAMIVTRLVVNEVGTGNDKRQSIYNKGNKRVKVVLGPHIVFYH